MNQKNIRRWTFITAMSFIFYGWWDWRFLFLILFSGLIDYFAGKFIYDGGKRKKTYLIISLIGNLGGLAIFKYSAFAAQLLDRLLGSVDIQSNLASNLPAFTLIVPVGISFYTFQSMSYTIDIYRGRLKPVRNVMHFFAYLSMFPQLVAGPIVRAKDLLGQLAQKRIASPLQKWNGIKLIMFGLFQKTVLADNIGVMVNQAYSQGNLETGTIFWWLVMIGFAFQIYCDFSGYSLIARGLAKYIGYHFKMNFNHPYLSSTFKGFWTRWHISLSTWFRDYVYIPLGGSKKGLFAGLVFVFVTMVLSGIWHGAGFTFIAWGLAHATFLSVERLLNVKWNGFAKIFGVFVVFVGTTLAWNFFRATSMSQSIEIYQYLFNWKASGDFVIANINSLFFLVFAVMVELCYAVYHHSVSIKNTYKKLNLDVVLVSFCLIGHLFFRGPELEFIYFQF